MRRLRRKRPPVGGPGKALGGGVSGRPKTSTSAALRAFKQDLGIILDAAHRMAAGYGLAWSDYDRLHEAHQHVLRVLEAVHE